MIPIPQQLQGQVVQSYIDWEEEFSQPPIWDKDWKTTPQEMAIIETIRQFYLQPFQEEMIEEYFEGWQKKNSILYEHSSKTAMKIYSKNALSIIQSDGFYRDVKIPLTLNDFIFYCDENKIQLQWKQ